MTSISYSDTIPQIVTELCNCSSMLRIGMVGMNCGCEYTSFPMFKNLEPYSRLEHSLGVARIIWKHTGDITQTVAGLLHDISSPAFAHVIDFVRGDYMKQESTEDRTAEIICSDRDICEILSRYGIHVEAVTDYHVYPIADNDAPKLSADRLEYTLGNMVNYGFASLATAQKLYDDIIAGANEFGEPELVFRSEECAVEFAWLSLKCSEIYCGDADRYSMQILSEIIRDAVDDKVLDITDLYRDEPSVIGKLCSDEKYSALWRRYRSLSEIFYPDSDIPESRRIDAKRRCIDPFAVGRCRVSGVCPEYKSALDEFLSRDLSYRIAGR
ncbi:MAG: HD domain-containing protein [Candidatus Egerieousia sp.]